VGFSAELHSNVDQPAWVEAAFYSRPKTYSRAHPCCCAYALKLVPIETPKLWKDDVCHTTLRCAGEYNLLTPRRLRDVLQTSEDRPQRWPTCEQPVHTTIALYFTTI